MAYKKKPNILWDDMQDLIDFGNITKVKNLKQNRGVRLPRIYSSFLKNNKVNNNFNSNNFTNSKLKEVLIKNIADMKSIHTYKAINYAITHSDDGFGIDENDREVLVNDVLNSWGGDIDLTNKSASAKHLVFSIDEQLGDNEEYNNFLKQSLLKAVKMTLECNIPEYKYVIAIHTHQSKLHAHIIINRTNFNGKKMRFSSGEFKEFFMNLRSDFANFINISFLNLDNKPRYIATKKVERDLYASRLLELENIEPTIKILKEKFNGDVDKENSKLKEILTSQRAMNFEKIKTLESNIKKLEKELQTKQIYQFNVNKKIITYVGVDINETSLSPKNLDIESIKLKLTSSKSFLPTNLMEKSLDLESNIKELSIKIKSLQTEIKTIKKANLTMFDARAEFDSFNNNVKLVQRQESLIEHFNNPIIKQNSSKKTIEQVALLKQEIELLKPTLHNKLANYVIAFSSTASSYDSKTNTFELTSMLKNLSNYYTALQKEDLNDEIKTTLNDEIKNNINRVNILLVERLKFLHTKFDELDSKNIKLMKEYDISASKYSDKNTKLSSHKTLQRNIKNMDYMAKEFKKGMPFVVSFFEATIKHSLTTEISLSSNDNYTDLKAFIEQNSSILGKNILSTYNKLIVKVEKIKSFYNNLQNTSQENITSSSAINIVTELSKSSPKEKINIKEERNNIISSKNQKR